MRPHYGTFVQQFVWAIARLGHRCTVISPVSWFEMRNAKLPPEVEIEYCGKDAIVTVYRPRFFSFSSVNMGLFNTMQLTLSAFCLSVTNALQKFRIYEADVVYGHFLYPNGYAAIKAGRELSAKCAIGVGESSMWTVEPIGFTRAKKHFNGSCKFFANSSPNRNNLEKKICISNHKIIVAPNGVDLNKMYPRDKKSMRQKYGVDQDEFIVAFVGTNDHRKGGRRLLEAIDGQNDVKCIMVGNGTDRLSSKNIIRSGPVNHDLVPELLSCADIFVLPTLSEGSCNAVIEAIACGLPIVTSIGEFMDDIVDESLALRVDPMSVVDIRYAIKALKNDVNRRAAMVNACLQSRNRYDINLRAKKFVDWVVVD